MHVKVLNRKSTECLEMREWCGKRAESTVFEGRRCETRLAWACRSVEVTGSVQSGATGSFEN